MRLRVFRPFYFPQVSGIEEIGSFSSPGHALDVLRDRHFRIRIDAIIYGERRLGR